MPCSLQSRLATNSVTHGDMQLPSRIAAFVRDVNGGLRGLSLKNDALRRRYDAVKYDLKRVEGVVYDVSIRGLAQAHGPTPAQGDAPVPAEQ